jgi:hypothetical protein
MAMDRELVENVESRETSPGYSSYIIDFFFFVFIVALLQHFILGRFYASFFAGESSGAFMQFTHYVEALKNNTSIYWDHYLMLSSQEMPMSPLLSPITLILTGVAYLFDITELEPLAYIYATASYTVQVLCAFTMYLFLRFIGLGRIAAIIGGIGYCFNYFTTAYGIPHGFYRISALALMPIVFIFFVKLFNDKRNTLYYIAVSGFLLGLTFVLNGDVKPTIYFLPILAILAYTEGYEVHGPRRTTWILFCVMALGALITFAQFYPTLEALGEGVRSERTSYLPGIPLRPFNTLLGFSQNPLSFVFGFFFPRSFFVYYKHSLILGIAQTHLHEQKFTFGIFFFLLSSVGIFYRTKRHLLWGLSFLIFALYLLSSSTPLWPLFGYISEHAHIRYPTRASIMLYFLFSIYAAYGADVLLGRAGRDFYERYASIYLKYVVAFILIIFFGVVITSLQMSYDLFGVLGYTDHLTLFVSRLLLLFLVLTIAISVYISWKSSSFAKRDGGGVDVLASDSWTSILRWDRIWNVIHISFHILLSWISLTIALGLFKLWLSIKGATPGELSSVFFVEATFPIAIAVFVCVYFVVSYFLLHAFALLKFSHYLLVFFIAAVIFNAIFALGGGVGEIHQVHIFSLAILAVMLFLIKFFLSKYGPIDLKAWRDKPYYIKRSPQVVVILFSLVFALFIFSGFMRGAHLAPYLFLDIGGLKIQKEFLVVLIGLVLFLLSIIFGRKGFLSGLIVTLAFGSYLFLYTESTGKRVPPTIQDDPTVVFERDAELTPIYEDGGIDDYRIYIPRDVRRDSLSPELGYAKSHHTYCCRQYKDKLRFAFGQIVGPKVVERTRRSIFDDYSHPFWKLYNVGYIVDTFDKNPELLPKDPASYVRLSGMVIKLKEPRPLVWFMDTFERDSVESVSIDLFLEDIEGRYALDMLDKIYIHDYVPAVRMVDRKSLPTPLREPSIVIKENKSGTLRFTIETDRPGFAVFSEVSAPSWTVYVNGNRKKVVRAYGMLQAVWVEEGKSEVLFSYNAFSSTKMHLAFLLTTLASLFTAVVVGRRAVRGLDRG